MNTNGQIQEVLQSIQPLSQEKMEHAREYVNTLTKPIGSLGKIEELAIQLSGITNQVFPVVSRPGVAVFAADHGISDMGVSAYPKEVTTQMVYNFLNGGAAINVFSRQINAILKIVDIGVAAELQHEQLLEKKVRYGTKNFAVENAMTEEEANQAILFGMETAKQLIDEGARCLIIGEMGIGNTSSASVITSVITGCSIEEAVGKGTGLTNESLQKKVSILSKALMKRKPDPKIALDILSKIGGLEIGGMTGAIIRAAEQRIPVLLDGFISTSAALLACLLEEKVSDYLIAGHLSNEQGHAHALAFLNKSPLLNLELRLGEGTGAALSFPLVEAAARMMKEMATFQSAGIATKSQ
ncbi:nicotinate-nucleotide--dimethylbenzimidazole phosphoribosyltransferase [Bacillus sp. SA1-12]|uniref:nicotinate-nucleotide--dimethylbenzimidazole phosphoribosyltransferase n=1 Tax=Bacillus sp. SA1-12 TaxID=1455638 RepID=UPI000626FE8A|nr:nicotinate-nucleotide--dimethylbenzimidazole phosphoribosyltransferase [Bacillus sp. SA1-12]KKI90313.1 nicotinate-nucleotide--dimethylbenzimidazole phosphoribosyltransferase [Bacillus sp. SA1-12]